MKVVAITLTLATRFAGNNTTVVKAGPELELRQVEHGVLVVTPRSEELAPWSQIRKVDYAPAPAEESAAPAAPAAPAGKAK